MPILDLNQTWLYKTVKFGTLSKIDVGKQAKSMHKEIKRKQTWPNLGNTEKIIIICL